MIIDKINAIKSLRPDSEWVLRGDDLEWLDANNPAPTEEEIQAEVARLQAEYDAKRYQRDRVAEYPSFADQFDLLFHGGYEAWKASIQTIKDKYPKE